jgi:predicted nucleic acid-binding protein
VVSPQLLAELEEVLVRAKFRHWLNIDEAHRFVRDVRDVADEFPDPPAPETGRSADRDDEYLITLASAANVKALNSGDHHLTELTDLGPPVVTPSAFLGSLPPPNGR